MPAIFTSRIGLKNWEEKADWGWHYDLAPCIGALGWLLTTHYPIRPPAKMSGKVIKDGPSAGAPAT